MVPLSRKGLDRGLLGIWVGYKKARSNGKGFVMSLPTEEVNIAIVGKYMADL